MGTCLTKQKPPPPVIPHSKSAPSVMMKPTISNPRVSPRGDCLLEPFNNIPGPTVDMFDLYQIRQRSEILRRRPVPKKTVKSKSCNDARTIK